MVFAIDLDGQGAAEEIVAAPWRLIAFSQTRPGEWTALASAPLTGAQRAALARGEVDTRPARFRDLVIAGESVGLVRE